MKMCLFSVLLSSVFAISAQAEQKVMVDCSLSEGLLANQFEGTVIVEDSDSVAAVLELGLSRPGSEDAKVFANMRGSLRKFEPGRIGVKEVLSITLVDKGAKVSRASINVNMPGLLSSTVSVDGVDYRSTCKSRD